MGLANSNVQTTKPILTKIAPNTYFGLYIGQTSQNSVSTSIKNKTGWGPLRWGIYNPNVALERIENKYRFFQTCRSSVQTSARTPTSYRQLIDISDLT